MLAHEIGHALGMDHDFSKDPSNIRRDKKGKACTGIGGIMDYGNVANKWSSCSIQDFQTYITETKKRYGKFCIPTYE